MSASGRDTSWEGVADWYADYSVEKGNYHQTVVIPNLLRLMKPQAGQAILDLACGAGVLSAELAAAGATVIGVDASASLITEARDKVPQGKFVTASADKLPLPDHSFDTVVCVLAIQNIAAVKETFTEAARVLKRSGNFFLVLNHPAFRVPQGSSWGWDEVAGRQYRRIDEYLSEKTAKIVAHPGRAKSEATVSFHRSFQYYFKHLAATGFAVARLEEWISPKRSQPGPRQKEEDRTRKEFPLFLMLEAHLA
jgi:ubiquinone/menaquinone biosynthesis C-methylase UbiE